MKYEDVIKRFENAVYPPMVELSPDQTTIRNHENYFLFTAVQIMLCEQMGNPYFHERRDEIRQFIRECQVEPGLYNRFPGWKTRLWSHDEQFGLCYIASVLGFEDVKADILLYAVKNGFHFNNVWPNKYDPAAELGRIPGVTAITYMACDVKRIPIYDRIITCLGFLKSAIDDRGDISGKQLAYLFFDLLERNEKSRPEISLKIIGMFWMLIMGFRYKGGPKEMFKIYYRHPEQPANHFSDDSFVLEDASK